MSKWRVGLDVGRGAVKLLAVKTGEGGEVRAALRRIEAGSPERAEARAAEIDAIRAAASEAGLPRGTAVAVALPLAEAILKTERVPDMPAAEVAGFARLRALAELPFDSRDVVMAHALGGRGDDGMRQLLIAVARKERVESLLSMVREAGLEPHSLEPASDALLGALASLSGAGEEAVLLDVGVERSSLLLVCGGEIVLSRSVPLGTATSGDSLASALTAEVSRSLRAARREQPARLCLSGAGALDAGLRDAIESALKTSVLVLDGLAGMAGVGGRDLPGPLFAVARGLAGEAEGRARLDFLGEREAREAALVRRRRIALAAGLVLVLGATIATSGATFSARARRIEALQAAIAELKPRVDRVSRVAAEIHTAENWTDLKGRELDIVGALVGALPERAYLTRFQWTEGQAVKVAGRAADADVVASYIRSLERSPLIASASFDQITRYGRGPGAETDGVDFAITAHMKGDERRKGR